jgi:hypothetical protein
VTLTFRWKAYPITLTSSVVDADRPNSFAFLADAPGLHALHSFTVEPTPDGEGTVIVSRETQHGPLPWLGRLYLSRHLRASNQAWLDDLARAAGDDARKSAAPAAE